MKFLALSLIFSFQVQAQMTADMNKRWNDLVKLIDTEEKTIRSLKELGPRLRFRLVELQSERMRLLKEKENKVFLTASNKERTRNGKEYYFKGSRSLYQQTKKDGLTIIKNWPTYKDNASIYYTLAMNSRDFGNDNQARPYLLSSLKLARPGSPLIHHAKTGLAEHYYNDKKYAEAARYYKDVLVNKRDEWRTKHLYNASWCELKLGHHNRAIDMQREAFDLSKNTHYISVADQILDSVGTFYVMASRIEEGATFYLENMDAPGAALLKMARRVADNGGFKEVHLLLSKALENSQNKKNVKEEAEILVASLDFYRNFKRLDLYQQSARGLLSLNHRAPLAPVIKEESVDKLKDLVGHLQILLSKNRRVDNSDYDPRKLSEVIEYFDILAGLDPINTDQYRFLQGESYFSVAELTNSFDAYRSSLEFYKLKEKSKRKEELARKILDSMLALLGASKLPKDKQLEGTLYAYENHLALWPVDERSRTIYQRLFSLRLSLGQSDKSIAVIESYRVAYKEDGEAQRGMLRTVLDHFIKLRDSDSMATWTKRLENGYLQFDKASIEKTIAVLGQMLFEGHQERDKKGDKVGAAEGYLALFNDPKYPRKIKADSAFNASILYLDLFDTKTSHLWLEESLKLYNKAEALALAPKVLAMGERYFLLHDFALSAQTLSHFLERYAKALKAPQDFLASTVKALLLNKSHKEILSLMDKAQRQYSIGQELLIPIERAVLTHAFTHGDLSALAGWYKRTGKLDEFKNDWDRGLSTLWHRAREENDNAALNFAQKLAKPESDLKKEISEISDFDRLAKELAGLDFTSIPNPVPFDPAPFAAAVKDKIALLKHVSEVTKPAIQSGNSEIAAKALAIVLDAHQTLAQSFAAYRPLDPDPELAELLKKETDSLARSLLKQRQGHLANAQRFLDKNRPLNMANWELTANQKARDLIKGRYPASAVMNTLDTKAVARE
jgi:hypothetical protein